MKTLPASYNGQEEYRIHEQFNREKIRRFRSFMTLVASVHSMRRAAFAMNDLGADVEVTSGIHRAIAEIEEAFDRIEVPHL